MSEIPNKRLKFQLIPTAKTPGHSNKLNFPIVPPSPSSLPPRSQIPERGLGPVPGHSRGWAGPGEGLAEQIPVGMRAWGAGVAADGVGPSGRSHRLLQRCPKARAWWQPQRLQNSSKISSNSFKFLLSLPNPLVFWEIKCRRGKKLGFGLIFPF